MTRNDDGTINGIVAVTEHVPTAGAIVWWRLSGNVDAAHLEEAWQEQGLDTADLPKTPTASTALRRAVNEQRESRRLVRPLGKHDGFAIVNERVRGDNLELDYEVQCKARLDPVGRLVIEAPYESLTNEESEQLTRMRREIRGAFERHQDTLSTQDISDWLVRLMPKLDAVGLRDTGGVYFVPHPSVDRLSAIVRAVRKASAHAIHRVPALRSDDAVDAILDAVSVEAANEAESMEKDLEVGQLQTRGLENRVERCDEVEEKVTRYEELLGRKLDVLRERLMALRANLAVAIIKSQPQGEGQVSLANI